MTAKQIYEAVLTELNKLQAPSITLGDFNYFANKGISQYMNRKYNVYDTTQQTSDDMRVLKSSTILTPQKAGVYSADEDDDIINKLYGNIYEVNLPDDYFHILNCICIYQSTSAHSCIKKDAVVQYGANRLTSDMWGEVMNNYYMKPSYKRPYYYLHNVNTELNTPTNPIVLDNNGQLISGTDFSNAPDEKPDIPDTPPTPTQTYKVYYIKDFDPSILGNYVFSFEDATSQTITNTFTLDYEGHCLPFIIPTDKEIDSIEINGLNQMILYTNRVYTTYEGTINQGETTYQIIYLGIGPPIGGKLVIKLK